MKEKFTGLTSSELQQKIKAGQVNTTIKKVTRSYQQIFFSNFFTYFNLINFILFGFIVFVGSYKNGLFMFVIITNMFIGIFQEIRSKQLLEKLTMLSVSHINVIRDHEVQTIPINELVLEDIVKIEAGLQIPCDMIILEGEVEVNESLLSGEADAIFKRVGQHLYSGSYIDAGHAIGKVQHVGKDNYVEKIADEVKEFKKYTSSLQRYLNRILKLIGLMIIPLGVLLFYKQYIIYHLSFQKSIVQMVAAILGMIPEGLMLLTSVALTLGVIRLAKKKVLVQEASCIEMLSTCDTLCLDKTGTITKGEIQVEDVEWVQEENKELLSNIIVTIHDQNNTAKALQRYFNQGEEIKYEQIIPFSSKRKYSALITSKGTYYLGAGDQLFQDQMSIKRHCELLAIEGYRVLVFAFKPPHQPIQIKAYIKMNDQIRDEAITTLERFKNQGVQVKIISGDNPRTVVAVAKKVGVEHGESYVDLSRLTTFEQIEEAAKTYTVFGRVKPNQKKQLIQALKKQGHVVAMTGDGVNDVLAFKEADVSIALASGSDVAKNVANIVLLNDDFKLLGDIVDEGRRVMNNITYASSLFLVKTFFSFMLTICSIGFNLVYPFEPIQLSIMSACAVGIPTFLLTQEPNFDKKEQNFFQHVLSFAIPTALTIVSVILFMDAICYGLNYPQTMLNSSCVILTGYIYLDALERAYQPLSFYRKLVIYTMKVIYFICLLFGQSFLSLSELNYPMMILTLAIIVVLPSLNKLMSKLYEGIAYLFKKWNLNRYI